MALGYEEIIAPIIAWSLIIGQYGYLWQSGAFSKHLKLEHDSPLFPYYFFAKVREGWVLQNHLTGQAAANTTRDYLRVVLFYAGNAACVLPFPCLVFEIIFVIVIGTILVGYTVSTHNPNGTAQNLLLTSKLGMSAFLCFLIFYLFLYSARYGTHFHFLMNVKAVDGHPVTLKLITKVFHRSYSYYTAGLRLYFVLIPMFAWMISPWVLLVVTPIHLFIVYDYDNSSWMEKEIGEIYGIDQNNGDTEQDDGILLLKRK